MGHSIIVINAHINFDILCMSLHMFRILLPNGIHHILLEALLVWTFAHVLSRNFRQINQYYYLLSWFLEVLLINSLQIHSWESQTSLSLHYINISRSYLIKNPRNKMKIQKFALGQGINGPKTRDQGPARTGASDNFKTRTGMDRVSLKKSVSARTRVSSNYSQ